MDYCLVYFSTSVEPLDEKILSDILRQSHRNNTRLGVTGVILYVRGSILQVLEGPQNVIEALYERIKTDPRHTNVVRVLNRPIPQRLFGNWTMGYETISARQLEEIKAIVNLDGNGQTAPTPDDHIILKTIKVFYDSNRYN